LYFEVVVWEEECFWLLNKMGETDIERFFFHFELVHGFSLEVCVPEGRLLFSDNDAGLECAEVLDLEFVLELVYTG
jgi:hypothetical protein